MTVCIAARSILDPCVVGVSDLMLSYPDDGIPATDNVTIKSLSIGSHWYVLYAGSTGHAVSIADRAVASLKKSKQHTRQVVELAMKGAFQAELRQQLYDRYLSRYKITPEQFRRGGRRQFAEAEFGAISADLHRFSLNTSLLVIGFSGVFSQIFVVNSPNGNVTDHTALGYWSVGSGARMALSALAGRNLTNLSMPELVYRLCEAKFSSETARGVGAATVAVIMRSDGRSSVLWGRETEYLKKIWNRDRNRKAPKTAIDGVIHQLRHGAVLRA